ncbi:MAG: helix-turn-helix domain-containing protein [Bdellovibrionales bacterium]|nr:helix-turn-helix domain-containing protein [Bdellovibrionales bacterium]NQZ18688.1 helix-turn-helix domain-containing protein [Bdellovibrionales bacterium]
MQRIGDVLKNARKKLGLSLDDVAESTKIHINKLKAIEENNFEEWSNKVFIKGLIRTYAKELNIERELVITLCDQEFSEVQEIPQAAPVTTPALDEDEDDTRSVGRFQAPSSFFVIVSIIVVAVLVSFIYVTVSKIQSYSKEKALPQEVEIVNSEEKVEPIEETTMNSEKEETSNSDKKEAEPKSEKKIIIAQKEETKDKSDEDSEGEVEEGDEYEDTPKDFKKVQKNALSKVKAQQLADQIEPAPKTEVKPVKKETTVYSDNKLVIEAIEAVRVEIIWSDGKPQTILMKEKDRKTFVFSNPLTVNINNGGAVNIIFNNKFIGVPGELNSPISLKYP